MKGIAISMENKYSAPAVEKMLDIAELLSRSDSGYSINEIARLTGSPVNTVYRICMVLNERGYLISDPESGHFVPGSGFYFLGKAAERRMKLNTAAGPLLGRLAKESGESTQLVTLRENFAVIQMQFETENPIKLVAEIGTLLPAHCSAGSKVILANSPELADGLPETLTGMTPNTIRTREELLAELETVRESGIAYDSEECIPGVSCVGAPVFGADGKCIAGIDIMYLMYRVDEDKKKQFEKMVRKTAAEISERLGFSPAELSEKGRRK